MKCAAHGEMMECLVGGKGYWEGIVVIWRWNVWWQLKWFEEGKECYGGIGKTTEELWKVGFAEKIQVAGGLLSD